MNVNIADNISAVFEKVASAAVRSGRTGEEISIVAASKMNDSEKVKEAISCGITFCGENRVQEMLEKNALNAYDGAHLHFIGHLQKNKVKNVVGLAELIHGADSIGLLQAIGAAAEKAGIIQDVLLEINIGKEASKSGFSEEELPEILFLSSQIQGIRIRGLMAIPPICTDESQNRPFFVRMNQLFVDNKQKKYDNVSMDFLSMGMSADYEAAIECGSNMVRIGTGIFGPRNYPAK